MSLLSLLSLSLSLSDHRLLLEDCWALVAASEPTSGLPWVTYHTRLSFFSYRRQGPVAPGSGMGVSLPLSP